MLACVNYGTLTYRDHGKDRVPGERRLLAQQAPINGRYEVQCATTVVGRVEGTHV
jgi:hypothetical protein